ncbi:hypothetical protein CVT24_003756 [Panaeolus cyanescens]|uniref:Uncharacterized protein n=1 Tax=Panaeolus cyanescens TaxID=181874 RepID=A0A409YY98_9AGAR|nr:hypothetical protein CVT24_003756 [Panaeolus cyanescens]
MSQDVLEYSSTDSTEIPENNPTTLPSKPRHTYAAPPQKSGDLTRRWAESFMDPQIGSPGLSTTSAVPQSPADLIDDPIAPPPQKSGDLTRRWAESFMDPQIGSPGLSTTSAVPQSPADLIDDPIARPTFPEGRPARRERDGGPLPMQLANEEDDTVEVLPPDYRQGAAGRLITLTVSIPSKGKAARLSFFNNHGFLHHLRPHIEGCQIGVWFTFSDISPMSSGQLQNKTFDDRDSHLTYQGKWFLQGAWNAPGVGQSGTLSSTNDLTSTVTFTFPEPAVAFFYYGMQRSNGGLYGICVDCDPNNPNWVSIDALNRSDNGKNPPASSTATSTGTSVSSRNTDSNAPTTPLSVTTLPAVTTDGVIPGTTTPLPGTGVIHPGSNSTNGPVTAGREGPISIGPIIGGILGGLALILALISFAYWYISSRRKVSSTANHIEVSLENDEDNATTLPSKESKPYHAYAVPPPKEGYLTRNWEESSMDPRSSRPLSTMVTASGLSSPTELNHDPNARPTASSEGLPARGERDGGPLLVLSANEEDDDVEVLPPDYQQVFGRSRRTRKPVNTLFRLFGNRT